jgi:NADPH:quinone reductase-like Zn-dependent oxidoreductase
MKLLIDGVIGPDIGQKFDLEHFKEAIEQSIEPKNKGKVFIVG